MNNEDYASYELALKLKECGFDEPCNFYYTKEDAPDGAVWFTGDPRDPQDYNHLQDDCPFAKPICSAPHIYHAQKWLREKMGIAINVISHDGGAYDYDIVFLPNAVDCDYPIDRATFSRTYEEALSEGIESVLELIKEGE